MSLGTLFEQNLIKGTATLDNCKRRDMSFASVTKKQSLQGNRSVDVEFQDSEAPMSSHSPSARLKGVAWERNVALGSH